MNYLLLLLGAICFMLILIGKAKGKTGYTFSNFIFKNWHHLALNVIFGIACIVSDGKLLNTIYDHWGNATFIALGGAGGTVAKALFDTLKVLAEKLKDVWSKIVG